MLVHAACRLAAAGQTHTVLEVVPDGSPLACVRWGPETGSNTAAAATVHGLYMLDVSSSPAGAASAAPMRDARL